MLFALLGEMEQHRMIFTQQKRQFMLVTGLLR